jgi:hypothetical protein
LRRGFRRLCWLTTIMLRVARAASAANLPGLRWCMAVKERSVSADLPRSGRLFPSACMRCVRPSALKHAFTSMASETSMPTYSAEQPSPRRKREQKPRPTPHINNPATQTTQVNMPQSHPILPQLLSAVELVIALGGCVVVYARHPLGMCWAWIKTAPVVFYVGCV